MRKTGRHKKAGKGREKSTHIKEPVAPSVLGLRNPFFQPAVFTFSVEASERVKKKLKRGRGCLATHFFLYFLLRSDWPARIGANYKVDDSDSSSHQGGLTGITFVDIRSVANDKLLFGVCCSLSAELFVIYVINLVGTMHYILVVGMQTILLYLF